MLEKLMRPMWFIKHVKLLYDLIFFNKTHKTNQILHKTNVYARQKKGLMGSI